MFQSVPVAWSITAFLLWRDIELSGIPPETEYLPYISLRFTHRKSDNKVRGCCINWRLVIISDIISWLGEGWKSTNLRYQDRLSATQIPARIGDVTFISGRIIPSVEYFNNDSSATRFSGLCNGRWTSFECYGTQLSRLMADKRTIMS